MDGAMPPFHNHRTGAVHFARPDGWKIEWNDVLAGGDVAPSAIFTREGKLLLYWGAFHLWGPQASIDDAITTNAGISGGITYALPSLLLGRKGYFNAPFTRDKEEAIDGKTCVLFDGKTADGHVYEIAVDPAAHAIVRVRDQTVIRQSDMDRARQELAKDNPEAAKEMAETPPQPDRIIHKTTSFTGIVFDAPVAPGDCDFTVPDGAQYVDDVSQAATAMARQ
jgi:hypothetical protein